MTKSSAQDFDSFDRIAPYLAMSFGIALILIDRMKLHLFWITECGICYTICGVLLRISLNYYKAKFLLATAIVALFVGILIMVFHQLMMP